MFRGASGFFGDVVTPEQKARQKIDRLLTDSGWNIQNYREINNSAGLGVSVGEFSTDIVSPSDGDEANQQIRKVRCKTSVVKGASYA